MDLVEQQKIINDLIQEPKYSCEFCQKLFLAPDLNLYTNKNLQDTEDKIICNECLKEEKKRNRLSFLLSSMNSYFDPDREILASYSEKELDECYDFLFKQAEKIWESNGSVNKKILMEKVFSEHPEKIPKSKKEFDLIRVTLNSVFSKYDNGAFEDKY
ncbi:MAG: hypothetical protein K2K73_03135 [Ureaplasma sp.]|nr:hypothetical protein [Ureaplasma sp.]